MTQLKQQMPYESGVHASVHQRVELVEHWNNHAVSDA